MNKQNKPDRPIRHERIKLRQFLKPKPILLVSGLFVLLATIIVISVTWAQSSQVILAGGDSVEIICEGRGLRLQKASSRSEITLSCAPSPFQPEPTTEPPTATAEPPKPEPTATPLPDPGDNPPPEPTSPPNGERIEPYAGAPECESHDKTAWHGLWDYERGCHYSHTHNADPTLGNEVFGPWGTLWNGDELSYPWQTFSSAGTEQELKHEGYKYDVSFKDSCQYEGYEYLFNQDRPPNCVAGWRIQMHVVGGATGANTRLHSYYTEVQVCDRERNNCGTIKTGGWADFGRLMVPYKEQDVPLPGDLPEFRAQSLHAAPYRGHSSVEQSNRGRTHYTWNSDPRYGYNQLVAYDFRTLDDWGGLDPNRRDENGKLLDNFVCPDYQCDRNHSTLHVYEVSVLIPQQLDGTDYDKDPRPGFVSFKGFTNREGILDVDLEGVPNIDCTAVSETCVPVEIDGAPTGFAVWSRALSGPRPDGEIIPEYDLSPKGEWWIKWPN